MKQNSRKTTIKWVLRIAAIIAVMAFIIPAAFRVARDIQKKLAFENTYAIQNVASGTAIRPYNAQTENGNQIIGYSLKEWECVTWEMIDLGENTFLLKNLFTEKTFQPKTEPKAGVELWQQSMGGTALQYWEFLKQKDGLYKIRLKNINLLITVSSNEVNAPLILMPDSNSETQFWKLKKQNPWI